MAEVVVSRRAAADLRRLRSWLSERDPEAAQRAAEAIAARIHRLRSSPRLGPLKAGLDGRELQVPFGRYGYVVRYLIRDDTVVITRIFHGREDR